MLRLRGALQGAIIRCNAGHCATAFHPLCARNNGQHLATREGPTAGRAVHRAYCALHSDAQREKDIGHATAMEVTPAADAQILDSRLDPAAATTEEAFLPAMFGIPPEALMHSSFYDTARTALSVASHP